MATPIHIPIVFVSLARMLANDNPEQFATAVDLVAHQRYASVSGLYWHTDLASAQAVARTEGKPILHLRMLGRLDEDLSCANSRLFRTTLYANADVAAFLAKNFVLVWTTERPVPQITIDFGDGRKIQTTATGNSAHYVMDADGRVLDVLPGLYAPATFKKELQGSLGLALQVRTAKTDAAREKFIVGYHQREAAAAQKQLEQLGNVAYNDPRFASELEWGQRMTVSKAAIEVRPLRAMTLGAALRRTAFDPDEAAMWTAAGTAAFGLKPATVLDDRSKQLVLHVHDGELPADLHATAEQRTALVDQLARHVIGDTALDQLILRPQISRELARLGGKADFPSINTWIYTTVFHTAASDPWIGLLPRTTFTGVPGDGVVLP